MQLDFVATIQRIDRLITIKGTGPANVLAARVGVSRTAIYQYLKLLKDMGCPVSYDRSRQTYYYTTEGRFVVKWLPSQDNHNIA